MAGTQCAVVCGDHPVSSEDTPTGMRGRTIMNPFYPDGRRSRIIGA